MRIIELLNLEVVWLNGAPRVRVAPTTDKTAFVRVFGRFRSEEKSA